MNALKVNYIQKGKVLLVRLLLKFRKLSMIKITWMVVFQGLLGMPSELLCYLSREYQMLSRTRASILL